MNSRSRFAFCLVALVCVCATTSRAQMPEATGTPASEMPQSSAPAAPAAAESVTPSQSAPLTAPAAASHESSPPSASENSPPSEPAPASTVSETAPPASSVAPASPESSPAASPKPLPEAPPSAPAASSGTLPRDLSPWGMFQQADVVVKSVMIGLAIASFLTWTVWLAKAVELMSAKRGLRRAIGEIASADSLSRAVEMTKRTRGPAPVLIREAAEEIRSSAALLDHVYDGRGLTDGIKERVTSRLSRVEAAAGRRMTLGTGVLATIGAVAPFVGLFGTVWGIMNAFIGISEAQTTNLAVVAPGIAEALLTTALGLVAAIPAVVIYNVFARSIAGYRLLLADASAVVERMVSRELDLLCLPQHGSRPFTRAAE
ncbi:tonB-system energizer ExbB [Hyphomicrobium sp. 2TAF46]|uniref:tonB-system energizer ExbB n=1 Tax=Hyphomicrobium sp. 2TAF46 TaxID=3233019 RepID=UPI003F939EC4